MTDVKKTIPLVAFCLYFLKIGILGASYQDACVLCILAGFSAFLEYKNTDKKILELSEQVNIRQKELEAHIKDIDNLKSYVTSSKLNTAMRPMNVPR